MSKAIRYGWVIGLILLVIASCSSPTPIPSTPTLQPPTPSETSLPTETSTVTPTVLPPSATPTEEPTFTLTLADTDTPTPTITLTIDPNFLYIPLPQASSDTVNIFFIKLVTGSSCNDRVIAVSSGVKKSGDIEPDMKAGLAKLFSYHQKFIGDLYNPLYASSLKIKKVEYISNIGLARVHITGFYKPSDDPCDNLRVKAQIWSTIKQFRGIDQTNIHLNNGNFGDRLSNDK